MQKIKFILVSIIIFLSSVVNAQNKIVLDLSKARDTISRHIYGHFAEHLGRCIYDGFYVGKAIKQSRIKWDPA
jgi:alpha-N-arabinofuranosidase